MVSSHFLFYSLHLKSILFYWLIKHYYDICLYFKFKFFFLKELLLCDVSYIELFTRKI